MLAHQNLSAHLLFVTQLFLGQLREAEVERINDRISQAVMETCLAMTIFREEFNVEFCTMFTVLTFVKVCIGLPRCFVGILLKALHSTSGSKLS